MFGGNVGGTSTAGEQAGLWDFVEKAATRRSELAIKWYNDRVKPEIVMDHHAAWFHPVKRARINKVEGFKSREEFRESVEDLLIKPCILACLALLETVTLALSVVTLLMKVTGGILTGKLTLNEVQKPASDAIEAFTAHFILDALFIIETVLQVLSFGMKSLLSLNESARKKLEAFNQSVDEGRGEQHVQGAAKTVYDYIPPAIRFGA